MYSVPHEDIQHLLSRELTNAELYHSVSKFLRPSSQAPNDTLYKHILTCHSVDEEGTHYGWYDYDEEIRVLESLSRGMASELDSVIVTEPFFTVIPVTYEEHRQWALFEQHLNPMRHVTPLFAYYYGAKEAGTAMTEYLPSVPVIKLMAEELAKQLRVVLHGLKSAYDHCGFVFDGCRIKWRQIYKPITLVGSTNSKTPARDSYYVRNLPVILPPTSSVVSGDRTLLSSCQEMIYEAYDSVEMTSNARELLDSLLSCESYEEMVHALNMELCTAYSVPRSAPRPRGTGKVWSLHEYLHLVSIYGVARAMELVGTDFARFLTQQQERLRRLNSAQRVIRSELSLEWLISSQEAALEAERRMHT